MLTHSEMVRQCKAGVVNNPYQGADKKVLFVCSMGILRSATAARIYGRKYNTRSAGTYDDALIPITPLLVAWADQLVFVNPENYWRFREEYPEEFVGEECIKVLNIPDCYEHMHKDLIKAFEEQYEAV